MSVAVAGAAGCGGAHPQPATLRLERADLVLLTHTLQRLQATTAEEAAAAREAWPALASGLPRNAAPVLRVRVASAERSAAALTLPTSVTAEGGVTGPAAKLAGMLKSYVRLTQRGWQYLATALSPQAETPSEHPRANTKSAAPSGGESAASARFLRANAPLYIYCVYDGHYHLSLLGKALQGAYRTLGGAPAFDGSLTQGEVEALARAYSIPTVRLQPHPAPGVVV